MSTDFYAISKDINVFNGVNEVLLKDETIHISLPFLIVSLLAMILVIWRHRENIVRLIRGKEPRIGQP